MNFQSHQALARSNTVQLVGYLALGTLGLVASLGAIASYWFFANVGREAGQFAFTAVAVLIFGFVALSGIVKGSQIRQGGGAYLAASLGGYPVDFSTRDNAERQLVNIVEEIAIASGMPVPAIFVLHEEPGINAFAAGWNADDSVVGVTRGALHYLSRNELQAVVAHEFSHIANGDTRVKTRIIGWVYGIAALAIAGKVMSRSAGRTARGSAHAALAVVAVATVFVIAGWIGSWFARRMQAAVNREREHLADASAVRYTRNPEGLAGALKKIGALGPQNELQSAHAVEAAHLFFESPFAKAHSPHLPLRRRIWLLDKSWDGHYPPLEKVEAQANHAASISYAAFLVPEQVPGVTTGTPLDPMLSGIALVADVGTAESTPAIAPPPPSREAEATSFQQPQQDTPTDEHVDYVRHLLTRFPQETKDYLHTRQGAIAAVIGLLASTNPGRTSAELQRASELTLFPADYLSQASRVIGDLQRELQLPAIEIALQSIRQTPVDVHQMLIEIITEFAPPRPESDLFRWMLRRVLLRGLSDADAYVSLSGEHTLASLSAEASVVYAVIAGSRSADSSLVSSAFGAAHESAGLSTPSTVPSGRHVDTDRVDAALDRLAELTYRGRVSFVEGAIAAVQLDSVITAEEAELVRVVAEAVRLAMPPLLPAQPPAADSSQAA